MTLREALEENREKVLKSINDSLAVAAKQTKDILDGNPHPSFPQRRKTVARSPNAAKPKTTP